MRLRLSSLLIFTSLLLTLLSPSLSQTSDPLPPGAECDIFFQYLYNVTFNKSIDINVPSNIPQDALIFLDYSGHSINDLGYYKQCKLVHPARNYFLMELTTGAVNVPDGSFGLYMGMCLPNYCNKDYLDNQTASILDFVKLFRVKLLTNVNAKYIDPNAYQVEYGFWFYFTVLLFSCIFILNCLGTYLPPFIALSESESIRASIKHMNSSMYRASVTKSLNKSFDNMNLNNSSFKSDDDPAPAPAAPKKLTIREKLFLFFKNHPKLLQVLRCFDFSKNLTSFFQQEKDARMDQNLNILDGIRTMAFFGIIFAHTYLNSAVSKNEFAVEKFAQDPGLLIALAAFFGVDVFFLLSGFLQGFQLVSKLKKTPLSFKSYALLIRHRWIRLAPTYFIAILLYWKIAVHYADGPLWFEYVNRAQQCSDSWWKNILFLDNVLNRGSGYYCFNWGWYLACDFQMFLVAPFVCWIYVKSKTRAYNLLWILGMITFIAGFWGAADVNFQYNWPPESMTGNFWAEFYSNTLVRISTYLVGLFMGTQYRGFKSGETDNIFYVLSNNHKKAYIVSAIGFATLMFTIFFPRVVQTGTHWSKGFNYLWQVIDRPMLAGGLFFAILPALFGMYKPVTRFFGCYFFLLCSRLSYCGYLVQLIIILMFLKSQTVFLGFAWRDKNAMVVGFIVVSLVMGALLHLFVEKPALNLEVEFISKHGAQKGAPENKGQIVKRSFLKK